MEGYCRSCLVKYDDATLLQPYSEKNRRLYFYATGLQVKRNDSLPFQLCRDCYEQLKTTCSFKKQSRRSDKFLKKFTTLKEDGSSLDLYNFLKNDEDTISLRVPFNSCSTPIYPKRDDDNDSTSTSIRNFMTDILKDTDIVDAAEGIIREVIAEEADIFDDSLDSQWLQNDTVDFRPDFSFTSFPTPRRDLDLCDSPPKVNAGCDTTDNLLNNITLQNFETQEQEQNIAQKHISFETLGNITLENIKLREDPKTIDISSFSVINNAKIIQKDISELSKDSDSIDKKLKEALSNNTQEIMLDDLLKPPSDNHKDHPSLTPIVHNILFGDNSSNSNIENNYINGETTNNNVYPPTIDPDDTIEQLLKRETKKLDDNIVTVKNQNIPALDEKSESSFNISEFLQSKNPVSKDDKSELLELSFNFDFNIETMKNEAKVDTESVVAIQNIEVVNNKEADKLVEENGKNICKDDREVDMNSEDQSVEEVVVPKKVFKFPRDKYDFSKLLCNICDRYFKEPKYLKIHFNRMHKMKIKDKGDKATMFNCKKCGKKYSSRLKSAKHTAKCDGTRMEKPAMEVCQLCYVEFPTLFKLKRHLQKRHKEKSEESASPYVCITCGKAFRLWGNFLVHMKRHEKKYLVHCPICDKGFYRSTDLATHYRSHVAEKPHVCKREGCGKSFTRSDALYRHTQTHIDKSERQYGCEYCEKRFNREPDLRNHIISSKTCLSRRGVEREPVQEENVVPISEMVVSTRPNWSLSPIV